MPREPVVTFVTRILPHYRLPFHDLARTLLAARGIRYRLIYGQPDAHEAAKGDLVALPWAKPIRNRPFFGRGKLVWQPIMGEVWASDLVILGQENQLLVNYVLQLPWGRLRKRIALWGHGRNFQSRDPDGLAERWKRIWATRCHWFFAYTEETRAHLLSLNFPDEHITVINNAIDTAALRREVALITSMESAATLETVGATGDQICIFVGGIYPDKRVDFLVKAADRVRVFVPGFTLVVVGGGVDQRKLELLAATRPWLVVVGPRFGREKLALMRGARLFLMPGLVGLAVLDAAATGLPMVTTAYPYHSPEIVYLRDGENGVIVPEWHDSDAYADAVVGLLLDPSRCDRLATAALATAAYYSIDAMAERFADGVVAALR